MRLEFSLNGNWLFMNDLDPRYFDSPYVLSPAYSYASKSIDRRHWKVVRVPGVWQKYGERYDLFEGVGWYYRTVEIEDIEKVSKAIMHFGAVNYLCRLYVNEKEAGVHEGGYTAFSFDITPYLQEGTNHIAVAVDNRGLITKFPPVFGYYNYGGIHRECSLEVFRGTGIEEFNAIATWEDGALLSVFGRVHGGNGCPVEISVCGEEIQVVPDADGVFAAKMSLADAQPWSPDTPVLYELKATIKDVDIKSIFVGFKSLVVKDQRFLLNGEPIHLNGICYVFDDPVTGLVMDKESIQRDIKLMKEMGVNAIRCHYTMDDFFYEECDRVGILTWAEVNAYNVLPGSDTKGTIYSNPDYIAAANLTMTEMVQGICGHACVAFYSIGSECDVTNPESEPFFRGLADCARSLDNTKLIAYAGICDWFGPMADIVDVLGINLYHGWSNRRHKIVSTPENLEVTCDLEQVPMDKINMNAVRELLERLPDNCAYVYSEFGADSIPGYYSKAHEVWSENCHAAVLHENFKVFREYPKILGTFPFCFNDYRDPTKRENGNWDQINLKGAVTYSRRKRMAYYAIQEEYQKN